MNEKKLKSAGIDCLTGIRRFAGSADLYEKYLKKFVEDENLNLAKAAILQKNYEDALKYVHTLKGVAGNLSMTELFDRCSELVNTIRSKEFNKVDEIFNKICLVHTNVCEAIRIENKK